MTVKEIVLKVGAELGSLTIFRIRQGRRSRYQLSVWDGTPDLLDEPTITVDSEPIDTWDATLRAADKYYWHRLTPIQAHPAFRRKLWKALGARINADVGEQRNLQAWAEICGVKDHVAGAR